jgi:ubiquinone/menaquinone biosynthesis C-methylase UbiE
VTAIDLTEEYCETARWLNQLVGLDDRISVRHGSVTDLPFADGQFHAVISQHVQMNVADKVRLYREARRVLKGSGRLAIWDITSGRPGPLDYPLPWADQPGLSHLVRSDQLRGLLIDAGFIIDHWADLTEDAAALMGANFSAPPGPLGLHTFVDNFAAKVDNLIQALAQGHLRVVQGVARAQD